MNLSTITKQFGLFFLAACLTPLAWAEPQINARVSAQELSLNDSINLSIELTDVGNINQAPLPEIPGFSIQRAGQTRSFQWINGKSSSLLTFNYVLTPTQVGDLQIPPLSLKIGDQTITSQPISIKVNEATAQAPPEPTTSNQQNVQAQPMNVPSEGLKPLFMAAELDKSKVYVGEQILLSVKFLRRSGVSVASQPQYTPPDMVGFLVENLKRQEYTTTIQNVPYEVTELRYALFPTSDGEFAVGSAQIDVAIRSQGNQFNPNSFFESFFGRTQNLRLTTRALPIQVRALPKNKPTSFTGAVGRFSISAKTDTTEPEVGQPLNVIYTVQGVGNVKTLKEPEIPKISALRQYEIISNSNVNLDGPTVHGSKEFKVLMIPQVSGQVRIPSVQYPFFNPDNHSYQVVSTPEIMLDIKPGTLTEGSPENRFADSAPTNSEGVRVMERDIRFLKSGPLAKTKPPFYKRGSLIAVNTLPILFALAALATRWQTRHRKVYASKYRYRGAGRKARAKIKQAEKLIHSEDPVPFYASLFSAMSTYIADKLDISPTGLVWEDLDRKLIDQGVDDNARQTLRNIWDEADMVRFASSRFDMDAREKSLEKSKAVLTYLDKVFS